MGTGCLLPLKWVSPYGASYGNVGDITVLLYPMAIPVLWPRGHTPQQRHCIPWQHQHRCRAGITHGNIGIATLSYPVATSTVAILAYCRVQAGGFVQRLAPWEPTAELRFTATSGLSSPAACSCSLALSEPTCPTWMETPPTSLGSRTKTISLQAVSSRCPASTWSMLESNGFP